MRSLFLMLLVINLSYLVWGVAFSEKNTTPEVIQQPQGEQTLTLLSEQAEMITVNTKKQPSSKVEKTSKANTKLNKKLPPSMAPAKTCYSLGPILDEKNRRLQPGWQ